MAQKNKVTIETLAIMMQKGLNEVNEKLDDRLNEVHEKLDDINEKLDQKPDRADLELKADKVDIDRVVDRIGRLADKIDDDRSQQSVIKRQVEKHERWHYQTAEKVGIKLED